MHLKGPPLSSAWPAAAEGPTRPSDEAGARSGDGACDGEARRRLGDGEALLCARERGGRTGALLGGTRLARLVRCAAPWSRSVLGDGWSSMCGCKRVREDSTCSALAAPVPIVCVTVEEYRYTSSGNLRR